MTLLKRSGPVGLLVLVVVAAAVFASSAQALVPKFLVGKKAVGAGLNAKLEGTQIGRDILLISALNTEFNCEKFTMNSGVLATAIDGKGELTYEECSVLELKTPLGEIPCTVKNAKKIVAAGLVIPAELVSGAPAVLVEAITALIGLEGAECPLPLDNIVKGELCVKIENNDTVNPVGVASQTIQGECKERPSLEASAESVVVKDKLLYGAQEAFTDIKADLFLTGAHAGLTVGVSLQ